MKKSVKKALGILIALLLILIALSASLLIINKPKDRTDNTFVVVKIKEGSYLSISSCLRFGDMMVNTRLVAFQYLLV